MKVHAQSLFALAILCALLGLPETDAKAVFKKRDGDVGDLRAELKKVLGQLEEKLKTRGLNAQKRIPDEFGGDGFPDDPDFQYDGQFGQQPSSEGSSMASSSGFMSDGFGDDGPPENAQSAPSDPSSQLGSGPSDGDQGSTEGGPGPMDDEQESMGDEQGPMGDGQGSLGDESGTPLEGGSMPPADENISPADENMPPADENMPPADDNTPLVEEDETDTPGDETQPPADENPNPADENPTPADENPAPADENPAPADEPETQEDDDAIPTFDIPEGVASAIADLTEEIRAHVLAMADEADTKEGLQQLIDEKVKKVEDAWKFYDRVLNKVIENVLGVNNEMITALFEDKK